MPRPIKASIILKLFDGDTGKENRLRRELVRGKAMVRRDEQGTIVADNRLDEDKGPPPKKPVPETVSPKPPRDPQVELARIIGDLPEELKP